MSAISQQVTTRQQWTNTIHKQHKWSTDRSKALLLLWMICVIYVLCVSCVRLLWSREGIGLTFWLLFVIFSVFMCFLSLSMRYWLNRFLDLCRLSYFYKNVCRYVNSFNSNGVFSMYVDTCRICIYLPILYFKESNMYENLYNVTFFLDFLSLQTVQTQKNFICLFIVWQNLSRDMRFPTTWYVRPAKAQTSLRIRAVWSEPLLVAWIFYEDKATDWTAFELLS